MSTLVLSAAVVLVVLGFSDKTLWLAAAALLFVYVRYGLTRPSAPPPPGGPAAGPAPSDYRAYRARRDQQAKWERRYRRERPFEARRQEQEKSRKTAFQVVRFARAFRPRWLVVENVVSMRNWAMFRPWSNSLARIGYRIEECTLNAEDFGVPQSRRRLFVICDLEKRPTVPIPTSRSHTCVKSILVGAGSDNGSCSRVI